MTDMIIEVQIWKKREKKNDSVYKKVDNKYPVFAWLV